MLTALALGFVLGLRHAFDPDHVIAVSALVARVRRPWTASWLGLSWGLGHTATVLAVGGGAVALRVTLPEGMARATETGVGAMLVLLGLANLAAAGRRQRGVSERADTPLRRAAARSGLVGVAHGLAGSAALALLATSAMPSPVAALVYLGAFGLGTVTAMVAFSLGLGLPAASLGATEGFQRSLLAGTGLVSLGFGVALIHRLGLAVGLLT